MIPAADRDFVVASAQAGAALIGLLFVAVSIAPERSFGAGAESGRQAQALSAFTALTNVFFVSFGALLPETRLGIIVVLAGVAGASYTLSLLFLVPKWRVEGTLARGITIFGLSSAVYLAEIAVGLRLWIEPADTDAASILLSILLGAFFIGLTRAWELLGAPHGRGLIAHFVDRFRAPPGGRPRHHTGGTTGDVQRR